MTGPAGRYEDLLGQLATEQRAIDALRAERADLLAAADPARQRERLADQYAALERRQAELDEVRPRLEKIEQARRRRVDQDAAQLADVVDELARETEERAAELADLGRRLRLRPPAVAAETAANGPANGPGGGEPGGRRPGEPPQAADFDAARGAARTALNRLATWHSMIVRAGGEPALPRVPALLRNLLVWVPAALLTWVLVKLVGLATGAGAVPMGTFLGVLVLTPVLVWVGGAAVQQAFLVPRLPGTKPDRQLRLGLLLCAFASFVYALSLIGE